MQKPPASHTVLITGASSGIGAVYADRFAKRGHPLVLVARDRARLEALASKLKAEADVPVEVLQANLTDAYELAIVEKRLREDDTIGLLVNNAGAAGHGGFETADNDEVEMLIRLNVTAVARLVGAVVPRFLKRGEGSIINIASVVAVAPESPLGIYGATKSFVLTMSQSLQVELGGRGLYVQAVLPAATRTEIWERSGRDVAKLDKVMDVDELVDAALVGFDRRELVTIPPLPDATLWDTFTAARKAMLPTFSRIAAARYKT
jgi:uncharacterized protein